MADWYFRNQQTGLKACPACRNLVRTNEEFCPYCAKRLRDEGGVRGLLRRLRSLPFLATQSLLGLIVLGVILQQISELTLPAGLKHPMGGGLFNMGTSSAITYVRLGANFHEYVAKYGEVWRFVTYCFLHFGAIHIVFNSWAFWDLGRLAERLWGARQVFTAFILGGIGGGVASFAWNAMMSRPAISAGASGAVCGVLGLLIGAYYRNRYHVGELLGSQLVRWAVMILAFGLIVGADNAAHIGGMLAGGALGYFMPPTRSTKTPGRDTKVWNALAILSLLLLLGSIGFAVNFYVRNPL